MWIFFWQEWRETEHAHKVLWLWLFLFGGIQSVTTAPIYIVYNICGSLFESVEHCVVFALV